MDSRNSNFFGIIVLQTNRFKGLDLLDRAPEELWMEVHRGGRDQNHPQVKEMQQGKMVI